MLLATSQSCYWPGITLDIIALINRCTECARIAPSQLQLPSHNIPEPSYPFQQISAIHMSIKGRTFLCIVDRYSNWPEIFQSPVNDSNSIIGILRKYLETFGILDEFASNGAPIFCSKAVADFLTSLSVHHRVSSVGFPHSNNRIETCVKLFRQMLTENIDKHREVLNNKSVTQALLV